ncbi:carboxypeptidase-like regulatory domain-containing protein [Hymenobacter pini]|uniref:carboxypeptidase-like regulatory domain-containing protein n=1 Tax=Hymenobacter pini TaxID=2880879 RepID=UPI001CF37CAB|nr:carboxypeptidase-like regulatory domain-containing protein [Hymenobacter pini]MCA8830614.1 carboxypeptidase-like regulatory domain-containing protein [Hymenobacter pini]
MPYRLRHCSLLLSLLLLTIGHPLRAQQLLTTARQQSYLTKVFCLTDAHTRRLYQQGLAAAQPEFFTQVVDSFPTDADSLGRARLAALPLGYYLVAHADGPELVYWLHARTSRQLRVLDNQQDLSLLVQDSVGRLLPDARVLLPSGRAVPFDAATQTYRLPGRRARPGLLAVEQGGRTTFHALQQTYPQPRGRRRYYRPEGWRGVYQRVVFGFPLGYLGRPVRTLVQQLHYPAGVSTGLIGLVRAPFSEEVRDQRQERRAEQRGPKWQAYVALSKPRYRPTADTLQLKARVLRRHGRPYRRPLALHLRAEQDPQGRRIAVLRPVRPGSYEYQLPLLDTLGLRSDQTIRVELVRPRRPNRPLAQSSFRLEDYELNSTRYALRPGQATHRAGTGQALFLRGQDANELNLLDARVRLSVTPVGVLSFPGRQVFVPDTLWVHSQPLDATGETRLNLPPAALPAANLTYQVQAVFLNGSQERRTQSATVGYWLTAGEWTLDLRQDSVVARYLEGGRALPRAATLQLTRRGPDGQEQTTREAVQLPLQRPVDARVLRYQLLEATETRATLDLGPTNAGLVLRSDRTADSIELAVDNPRRLGFWYYLYRGHTLVRRQYTTALALHLPAAPADTWYVSLHYQWGGELRTSEYNVPFNRHRLSIEAEQPAVVYPGQRVELRYTVRDAAGRPVPRTDLTSYAYTSKFEQPAPPAVPDFAPPVTGRIPLRRFALPPDFDHGPDRPARQPLPWGAWRQRLGLDSLRFYQFLYPEFGTFHEYRPAPGGLTQLAPFVVDSGRVQPTVAVLVDGVPVYVAAVNGEEPFALVADSGRHTVAIRTPTRRITLRDVYLRPLHKLTLSIDPNHPCHELTVEKPGPVTPREEQELSRFLLLVERNGPAERVLLRQGNRLQALGTGRPLLPGRPQVPYGYRANDDLLFRAGPFRPDSVLLRRSDGLRHRFLVEPGFRYSFAPGLLKMRSVPTDAFGDLDRAATFTQLPFADFAFTEADLRPRPATSYYRAPRPESLLVNPTSTPLGQGRLAVRLPPVTGSRRGALPPVLYTLVWQPAAAKPAGKPAAAFSRLLRYLPVPIHGLPPGRYRVALLLADSSVFAPDAPVQVQANGTTYVQLDTLDYHAAGPIWEPVERRFLREIDQRRLPASPAPVPRVAPAAAVAAPEPVIPQPDWVVVRGRVLERQSGEGMPGVTVLLKGTTHGVSTNADGSFALATPPAGGILVFSSIGYVSREWRIDGLTTQISMAPSTQQLNEVVVTGYGFSSGKSKGATIESTTPAVGLMGRVAGLQIQTVPDGAGGTRVTLRGARTTPGGGQALIIVDGLPFSGDLSSLDPEQIVNIQALKSASATAMYGSRAANGVILITTKNGVGGQLAPGLRGTPAALGPDGLPLLPGRDPRLALRQRFSDVGWWRPTLVTDDQGQARTTVTIPDDLTGWNTFVLASDDHARTGTFTQKLRSFKSLMAELAAPRFLVQGDRPQVIGKTLNYLPDTARVTTRFQVGEGPVREQTHRVATAVLDTLTFTAPATLDSVAVRFSLEQAGGYQDGELRHLPVLPAGTRERVGTFAVLSAADTTLTLPVQPGLGPVTVRLESDPLPVVLDEIRFLQGYAYLCNEQAASKLQGLLLEQRIRQGLQQPFRGSRDVEVLIRRLLRGRHQPEGLWGTWPRSPVSPWATLHVLEALLAAEQQGYKVPLDKAPLRQYLLAQLDVAFADAAVRRALDGTATGQSLDARYFRSDDDRIRLLHLLRLLGAQPDFATLIQRLEREPRGGQPLDRYLALAHLRQQLGLPYQLDSLRRFRLRTELGGAFYADTLHPGTFYRYLLPERLGTTLLAYQLLRAQGGHEPELLRLRTYLLQQRDATGHWASTYQSAQILATIGPDLLVPGGGGLTARAQLSGALAEEVVKFPFEATVPAGAGPLTVRKQGGLPVYATAYQSRWNPAPAAVATPFGVSTRLAGQSGSRVPLPAGRPAELEVTVDVPAEARYVLLEVPIPAGCSYGEPARPNSVEVHREYLRQQVGIFIDVLPAGRHTFRVALQPRYRGRYTLNPAKAELMYFPTRFGRTASKQAVIE